jgi:hypothetical protein
LLRFEEGDGYVVDGDAGGGTAVELAVMDAAMNDQVRAVPVYYFRQARGAEKRKNLRSLSVHSANDGRVMQHNYALLRPQLRPTLRLRSGQAPSKKREGWGTPLQLKRLIDGGSHKGLDLRLAECGQNTAAGRDHRSGLIGTAEAVP